MGGGSQADSRGGTSRPRRRLWFALGALLAAILALHAVASRFAADLFLSAAKRAASDLGFDLVVDGTPEVSLAGFTVHGVRLRRSGDGTEVLSVDHLGGHAALAAARPWLRWSLWLGGAQARWPLVPSAAAERGLPPDEGSQPAWPAALSLLALDDVRIDLGPGRISHLAGEARRDDDGSLVFVVARADYEEDAGEQAAEGLSGTLRLTPAAAATTRLDLAIDGGSALFGSTLLDFTAERVAVSATLAPAEVGEDRRLSGLTLQLGKLLRVTGDVSLAGDASVRSVDVEVESDDLGAAFVTLVRDPYGGVAPALADAVVEGQGKLKLRLASASRHAVDATIALHLRKWRTRSVEADAVDIDLPWIGARWTPAASRPGRVRAGHLALLSMPWSGFDMALVASPGRLQSREPLDGKVFSGTLHVSEMLFEDDPARGPRLSAHVRFEDFQLAEVGETIGIAGLSGAASGDLGRVSLDAGALRVDGRVDVSVFGGMLGVSKLVVDEPFSRVPTLGLDLAVSDIDLDALTRALGLGRVSGVLEGRVSQLVLAAGQPQAFDADLHTVKRKGVPQNVDVRAIVQLGVLGGADSGSITGTLLKMVDRYRYSALGLKARLRNDVFEIRGVRSERGRDYLVEGSLLPPSVSVVSHSQVVSFSEMLRRIRRIAAIGEGGTPDASSP